jgi:lipopolysaccharide biosynthesis protein/ubiquinone/menaquinone biosynthesis C-methylase UbiE
MTGEETLEPEALKRTGERLVRELSGDATLEGLHRYLMAREMARGSFVLDIASGEGYGSALLAAVARKVVGVEFSSDAVEHAARKYTRHNLHFALGSCSEIPLPDHSIDLVVSFETLEYHHEHQPLMKELKRVLRPRGRLLISSPDKYEHADLTVPRNPFHVKELYRHEFEELVRKYFAHADFYQQRVVCGSTILREDGVTRIAIHRYGVGQGSGTVRGCTPTYWVAVASDAKLPPGVSGLLEKPIEDIVRESERELAAREREIHELNLAAAELQCRVDSLGRAVEEGDRQLLQDRQTSNARELRIGELNGALKERSERVLELTRAMGEREERIQRFAAAAARDQQRIEDVERRLRRRQSRVHRLRLALGRSRRRIDDLTSSSEERERKIHELTRLVEEGEERIRALGESLSEREGRIAALSRALNRRKHQMVALREELRLHGVRVSKFREEALAVSSLRGRIRVFENSRSWRLTAPLRAVGRVLRRIRSFLRSEPALLLRDATRRSSGVGALGAGVPLSQSFPANQIWTTRFVGSEPLMESDCRPEVRALAFYLPQYHTIPENDRWWGPGFTDWHNVRGARPLFTNHDQPRIPAELGFYDLSRKETIERQAAMIRAAGLEGVCIYYYWFNGSCLLEKPLELIHRNPDVDLHYCLCWANENWTRAWDGSDHDVLIAQNYSEQDDLDFIASLCKYFSDPRYLRVHGKPLLLIYRLDILPDPKASADRWRKYCLESGIGEIYLLTGQFTDDDPRHYGADAAFEFPPHRLSGPAFNGVRDLHGLSASFEGGVHDYNEMVLNSAGREPDPSVFRTATMAWDNSARRVEGEPTIFINATPARYQRWLSRLCREAKSRVPDERLVFINAWNEWAEGVYLEPDRDRGYAYINATRRAVSRSDESIPRIAVVLHVFYWDLVDELADYISNMPFPFDLYVTATEGIYPQVFSYFNHRFPQASVNVVEVENRARDIGPFLTKFTSRYYDYDLVCKVHSKKSPHAPNLSGWRRFLLDRLLGSDSQIRAIVDEFGRDAELGLLYPTYFPEIRSSVSWGPNRHVMKDLLSWLEIGFDPASPCEFPAGSMFWFRPRALSTLIDFDFLMEEFPEETGQTDGTLAHAIERSFLFVVEHHGYRHRTVDLHPSERS